MHAGEPSLCSRSSKTPTTACALALDPLTPILSQPKPAVREIRVPYETYVQIEEKRGGVEVDLLVGVVCSKRGPSKQRQARSSLAHVASRFSFSPTHHNSLLKLDKSPSLDTRKSPRRPRLPPH